MRKQIGSVSDFIKDSLKTVNIDGVSIMVANYNGKFYAVDDKCTHSQCSLGTEGFIEGNIVTCGCHGGQFDITTGQVLNPPPQRNLKTYNIFPEGNNLFIEL